MKSKILYILMIIAVIFGIVVISIKDFNYSTEFSDHKRIEISLDKTFEINDMKKIAKDSIKSDSIIKKSTLFGTTVIIETKKVSDDEISKLLTKVNEKYGTDYELKDLKLNDIKDEMGLTDFSSLKDEEKQSKINEIKEKYGLEYTEEEITNNKSNIKISDVKKEVLIDVIKPYIVSVIISLGLILVYFGIRFNKLGKKAWIKEPLKLLFKIILVQLFAISIIAICRIPVNEYIVDFVIALFIAQVFVETIKKEKRLENKKEVNTK